MKTRFQRSGSFNNPSERICNVDNSLICDDLLFVRGTYFMKSFIHVATTGNNSKTGRDWSDLLDPLRYCSVYYIRYDHSESG